MGKNFNQLESFEKIMKNLGFGNTLDELKNKIAATKKELAELDKLRDPSPELISSANLIRENENLKKTHQKQAELLDLLDLYSSNLEKMLSSVLEIQNELKDLLRTQSSFMSKSHSKK